MTLQAQFDTTINLLARQGEGLAFVKQLLDCYKNSELTFHSFDSPSVGTTKSNLLGIYELRWEFEKDKPANPHVFGYDTLIPNFRQTQQEFICISSFMTEIGSFLIFSDFDRTELIGCLLSKTALQDTRNKMNMHKNQVESTGHKVLYDYAENENVFVNGRLQSKGPA